MTSHLGPRVVPYLELLRSRGEPSESVRIRVALDVLGLLAGAGGSELSPRGAESPGVDSLVIASDGTVQLTDPGDATGAAILVWEILAGRRVDQLPPSRLHDVLDEIHPDVDAVMTDAVLAPHRIGSVDVLGEELAAAAQGRIATREKVTLELGTPAGRSQSPPSRSRGPSVRATSPSMRAVSPSTRAAPPSTRAAPPSIPAPGIPVGASVAPAPDAPPAPPPSVAPALPPAPPSAPPAPSAPPSRPAPAASGASASPPPPVAPDLPAAPIAPPAPRAPPPPDAAALTLDDLDEEWAAPRATRAPSSSRRPSIRAVDDLLSIEQQARAAAVQTRALERAAFVRDGARAVVARKLAAEYAAAERAAEEAARLAEAAARAAAERAEAESRRREQEATTAETQALRRASERTAQLLTGALDVPRADVAQRTVLLIMPRGRQQEELSSTVREAGFAVAVHHDASSALATAQRLQPVCIVADNDLPDATGDATARQLRKQRSELALTPFLLLASPSDKKTGLSRFALGADVCMSKPFDTEEVVGQIAALVNMAARLGSARRAFPTLEPGTGRGFGGDLIHMSIAAILTVLELERRTGTFHLTSDGRGAELEIAGGLVVTGAVSGVPMAPVGALRIMLAWKNGRFAFEPQPPRDPPERAQNITDVLTAAMRYERAQPLQVERGPESRPESRPEPAPAALRLRPRDSKGR